jgi:16S rRNA (adenine1518-N6/adenine1519-N6)-dimethyltransferase
MKDGIKPIKHFGQNFLKNKGIIKKIISSAGIKPDDVVLEIGPGTGVLTEEIAKKAKKVISVEKDERLVKLLKERLKGLKNVEIIEGDILKFKNQNLKYKVVANLPYYITSPIIRMFLESKNKPKEMVLMMQKEVAERICAKPPDMNILALSVQFYGRPEILFNVSKKNFYPVPKVDSSVIKISAENTDFNTDKKFAERFFKIIKAGFSHPRKQIINNLSKALKIEKEKTSQWLLKNKISPERRAETISINEWIKLVLNCELLGVDKKLSVV